MDNLPNFYKTSFNLRLSKASWLRILVIAAILSVAIVSACLSQVKPNAKQKDAPDVLVLVLVGLGPYDQVSINYTSVISDDQAQKDLNTLGKLSRWAIQNPNAETQTATVPGAKRSTSVTFSTQLYISSKSNILPLEPFISTFKRFKTIEIDYLNIPGIKYTGLKNYEDEFVKINLRQTGNAYKYNVKIKDRGFNKLSLPINQPAPLKAEPMSASVRILLILGLTIAGAVAAYFITVYIVSKKASTQSEEQ